MQGCIAACPPSTTPADCARACAARLAPAARAAYEALEACVAPTCARPDAASAPCLAEPSSLACKMCVMSHCPTAASACLAH